MMLARRSILTPVWLAWLKPSSMRCAGAGREGREWTGLVTGPPLHTWAARGVVWCSVVGWWVVWDVVCRNVHWFVFLEEGVDP